MSENDNNQLVLFNSSDGMISLPVAVKNDSVWLTLDQISELFDRDKSTVSRHIHNVYRENELDTSSTVAKIATVQLEGTRKIERTLEYYNLDVIISVGYRVKSQRGVEFRRWANSVLKQYILQGYAVLSFILLLSCADKKRSMITMRQQYHYSTQMFL
jgi:Virulence protein